MYCPSLRLSVFGLLLSIMLHQTVSAAPWGQHPWAGRGPVVQVRPPLLLDPVNNHRIPDHNGNDVDLTFSWQGQSSVRQRNEFPQMARPLPRVRYNGDIQRLGPGVSRRFELCVYDNVRCDTGQSGFQVFLPVGNATSRNLTLPSSVLQGRTFQWSVRECVSQTVHPALAKREQSCVWSSSNQIHWDRGTLRAPCNLHAAPDAYYQPNLSFEWCDVIGADRYIICMSPDRDTLALCTKDTNWQTGLHKDSMSDNDIRIYVPPPANAGSVGGIFYWKVVACDVASQSCGDWSSSTSERWPQP